MTMAKEITLAGVKFTATDGKVFVNGVEVDNPTQLLEIAGHYGVHISLDRAQKTWFGLKGL